MGIDIHMYAEVRHGDEWEKVGDVFTNSYGNHGDLPPSDRPWEYRNYRLFSILANVRNYDNVFTPIAQPRGLPADVSPAVRALYAEAECEYFSASYLTLGELLDYNWQQTPTWKDTCAEFAGEFCTKTIPALQKLGEPDDVRIVFWFDN